jgi:hypothetical protein
VFFGVFLVCFCVLAKPQLVFSLNSEISNSVRKKEKKKSQARSRNKQQTNNTSAATNEMPIVKVVLVRHGESQWNKDNRFTGWTDVPLSEKVRLLQFCFPFFPQNLSPNFSFFFSRCVGN